MNDDIEASSEKVLEIMASRGLDLRPYQSARNRRMVDRLRALGDSLRDHLKGASITEEYRKAYQDCLKRLVDDNSYWFQPVKLARYLRSEYRTIEMRGRREPAYASVAHSLERVINR